MKAFDENLNQKIIDHLYDKLNIAAVKLEGQNGCQMEIGGKNFAYRTEVIIYQNVSVISSHSYSPITISKNDLSKVAEFIARANYNLLWGRFELDFESGTFRYSRQLEWDEGLKIERVGDLVKSGAGMMDIYIKYVLQMVHDDIEPEEALRRLGGLE